MVMICYRKKQSQSLLDKSVCEPLIWPSVKSTVKLLIYKGRIQNLITAWGALSTLKMALKKAY